MNLVKDSFIKAAIVPTSIAPLISFRIIWGFLTLISSARFLYLGWVDDQYIKPILHFHYYGFQWVRPLPGYGMYMVFWMLIVCSIGIIIGYKYRLFAFLFFVLFTYVELIDLTYYLNHYYFVSIIAFLMMWLPAHRLFSVDCWLNPALKKPYVSAWCVNIIKFQLFIVYFYAGIAKINTDWLLNAQPLKLWLPANDAIPLIGKYFALPIIAYIFSWFGMLYDVIVPFGLLWKRTRVLAFIAVVVFHCFTGYLFQIGVFPIVMIMATTIYFSKDFHQNLLNKISSVFSKKSLDWNIHQRLNFTTNRITVMMLFCFVLFQILFPMRNLLYPGSMMWTEEGYRFSWRVMLMEKAGTATFYVKDSHTGKEGTVINSDFLNAHQEKQMSFQPDMILQFAHYLYNYYSEKGVYIPQIRVESYVTLNGRASKLLIDPNVNLAIVKDGWKHKDWILPLNE